MGRFPPFDSLTDDLLDEAVGRIEVAYFKAGSSILELDQPIADLCYVRSGAVEVFRRSGHLFDRLGEGEIFGQQSLLRHHRVRFPARALEDTLIYFVPESVVLQLCEADEHFADFVEQGRPRLQAAVEAQRKNNDMMITRVRKLITRPPLILEADATVQAAARLLSERQASAALVVDAPGDEPRFTYTDGEGGQWQVIGILTDRDFGARVVAKGLPPQTPVGEVASRRLIAIQSDESVYEAMLCMLRNQVQHLPVMHRRRPVGIVWLSDIVRYETQSSLYLVDNIFSRNSAESLSEVLPDIRAACARMLRDGADSRMIGSALSTIGRSIIRRLLELAEAELGPPPVPYCFMALGSLARNEQTLVSDQDNALVLDDGYDPGAHDDYFLALAKRVSDGLAACGYAYCTGDIMATNPRWRQPLSAWQTYFRDWISDPTPERLLHSNIFFDLDAVHGEHRLVEALQDQVAETAGQSPLFLAAMARNALNRTPPLGFFRSFVMEKDGRHNNSINLKRRGTAPLSDLIRVHALACGSRAQNSFARLDDIAESQLLGPGVGEKLRYALEFLTLSRIRHQVMDLENDREPDNNIDPETLSDHERHTLKDAFQVLSNAQKFLRFRYPLPSRRR